MLFSESSFRYLIKLELKVQSLIDARELNVGAHAALVVRGCLRRPTLKKMVKIGILRGGDSKYSSSIGFNRNFPKTQTRLNISRRNNKNNQTFKD